MNAKTVGHLSRFWVLRLTDRSNIILGVGSLNIDQIIVGSRSVWPYRQNRLRNLWSMRHNKHYSSLTSEWRQTIVVT